MEKDYFDAKFEGIEKLMAAQDNNLKNYVGAVSSSVRDLRADLQSHKESNDAHGQGAREKHGSSIVAWLGFASGVVAIGVALWKHG